MRRTTLWRAGAAAGLMLTTMASADLTLTGSVQGGTYTRTDEDVYIYDATVVPGPGGVTTLTIVVHNGKIVVGAGLYSFGIDASGPDGADGWTFSPPQAGQPGRAGYSVNLTTDSLMTSGSTPRDRGIYIGKPIDCSGGAGGDGAAGADGYFDDCSYVDAKHGTTARPGSAGGNIFISAAGPVAISGYLDSSGGNGGQGGSGGQGILGPGGNGQPGGDGAKAGSVTVENNKFAPANAYVSLYVNWASTGSIAAYGGYGGGGGSGGTGTGPHPGGNGGNGGVGGPVKISAKNFSMAAAQGVCSIATSGGWGGAGGNGGDGVNSSCFGLWCSEGYFEYPTGGFGGANSGMGGDGGNSGIISIASADQFGMGINCGLSSRGGYGAVAGVAGRGGVAMGDMCDGEIDCNSFIAYGPGQTFPSGDGGSGGAITVACKSLSMGYYAPTGETASMDSSGGDGGDGVDGSLPGIYCCERLEAFGGHGGQGGAAGAGGSGANIKLTYTSYLVSNEPYWYCGGMGHQGGDGANGQPPGPGGVGSACGAGGTLYKNAAAQPSPCLACHGLTGEEGTNDLGLCVNP